MKRGSSTRRREDAEDAEKTQIENLRVLRVLRVFALSEFGNPHPTKFNEAKKSRPKAAF
jgi:hypothetical protein